MEAIHYLLLGILASFALLYAGSLAIRRRG